MRHTLVYLVGPPGVGKTTLMAELTKHCRRGARTKPFAHDHLLRPDPATGLWSSDPVAIELGKQRDAFSGTDALSMSVQPLAVDWIIGRPHTLVLGEGARLATVGFLGAAAVSGYDVHLVHLEASPATLDVRRVGRGSSQSPQWMRGAETRARRIMERMDMDATLHWLRTDEAPLYVVLHDLLKAVPALEVLTP